MTVQLRSLGSTLLLRPAGFALTAFAFLLAIALTPGAAQAQVVFDTFDDGDVSDVFAFSETGGGIGVGPGVGVGGAEATALSVGMNPADTGSFAGFVITGGEGSTDVSSTKYLSFFLSPNTLQATNLPLTLEINLHEDANGDGSYDGGTEDEYQAVYRMDTGSDYTFVQIPLASFTDDNAVFAGADDGFDFTQLLEIVIAVGGPTGPEFAIVLDEINFLSTPRTLEGGVMDFDTFNDDDVSDVFAFSETGAGIGVGTEDGVEGKALSVGLNPAETGSFAGFVITGGEGVTDASEAVYLRFFLGANTVAEANTPLTLEINLHEDANGDGSYDGGTEDEYQAVYRVTAGEISEVLIPLASFTDDNAVFAGSDDGFDFSQLLEIVIAIGGPTGPEFAFGIDQMGFVNSGVPVANDPDTPGLLTSYALSSAYPNPFVSHAQFDLTLEQTEHVRVEVYDVLGRRVALLHEGVLAGQTPHTFTIEATDWPNGLYLYRVTGQTFATTRTLTLVK